ncbi:hypothetical protein FACS1894116_00170 [Betaproteobacteria bacterium]|nr:hypothetical protein FACS1894116_00170 [Betaproteobacteria bacterium]GHT99328.1 hypothetical protein FACS1894154_06230 [Betaproteobacteria bacterium]GHU25026.1 hypothetical protein FACS189488_11000 [Betaproteobacteria bacterium]
MRLELHGHPEIFSVCLRNAISDSSTKTGFCGIAYSIRRVWVGDINLDAVIGTVMLAIMDVIAKIDDMENEHLFHTEIAKLDSIFFEEHLEEKNKYKLISYTDIGYKHSLAIDCECFDGFYIFGITHADEMRCILLDKEYPEYSFEYIVKKCLVRENLVLASNLLTTIIQQQA